MRPARRLLRPGCHGSDVKAMQRKLNADIKDDGQFGPKTERAVRAWKRKHGRRDPGPVVTKAMWKRLGVKPREWWPVTRTRGLTPGQIVNRIAVESQGLGFPHMSAEYVRERNAAHGPTIHGTRSDHQGPPEWAWAADISNGSSPTPEMDRLARRIAKWLGVPWNGSGLVNHYLPNGYRVQLIYRTNLGGNHYNHVHVGIRR